MSLVNFGMGLPPVVVGLATWLTLTRYGPLGMLGLLYTPTAMIIAQAIIASPIVAGLTLAAIQSVNPKLRLQMIALGATKVQYLMLLLMGGKAGHSCGDHRRFRRRDQRGRRFHDGRRKRAGLYARADHGHGVGSFKRKIRTGHGVEHYSAGAYLCHHVDFKLSAAEGKAAVTPMLEAKELKLVLSGREILNIDHFALKKGEVACAHRAQRVR